MSGVEKKTGGLPYWNIQKGTYLDYLGIDTGIATSLTVFTNPDAPCFEIMYRNKFGGFRTETFMGKCRQI